jgi:DNA-binding response OmpR family regulator
MSDVASRQQRPGTSRLEVVKPAPGAIRSPSAVLGDLRLIAPDGDADNCRSILLAHHRRAVHQPLTAALLRQRYRVIWCSDGHAALRYLGSNRPDLVVTGMIMPNCDGLELIRAVRGLYPALPIMALAEESDPMSRTYLRYAVLTGASSAYTVPVNTAAFLSDLDRILSGSNRAVPSSI